MFILQKMNAKEIIDLLREYQCENHYNCVDFQSITISELQEWLTIKLGGQPDVTKSVCEHNESDLQPIDDLYAKCKCGKIIMGYK